MKLALVPCAPPLVSLSLFAGVPVEGVPVAIRALKRALLFSHGSENRMIDNRDDLRGLAAFRAGFGWRDRRGFQRGKAGFQICHTPGQGAQVFPDRDLVEEFQNV